MKIAIPTSDGKLCAHFGHCESFTFAEIDAETKTITNIDSIIPEGGVSCQSAIWVAEQGIDVILAGGMGGRPLGIFAQYGIEVVAGCPELPIEEIINSYLNLTLETGENSCGGEHSHCHNHADGHTCSHHH